MIRPEDIVLDDDDRRVLATLNSRQQAVQHWIRTIQAQGEGRLMELQAESKTAWLAISDKYKVDLKATDYRLSEDGERLETFQVRFP